MARVRDDAVGRKDVRHRESISPGNAEMRLRTAMDHNKKAHVKEEVPSIWKLNPIQLLYMMPTAYP